MPYAPYDIRDYGGYPWPRQSRGRAWGGAPMLHAGECVYCGERGRMTRDHFVPLSAGGADNASNIVPACEPCNQSKGGMLPELWVVEHHGRELYESILARLRDA